MSSDSELSALSKSSNDDEDIDVVYSHYIHAVLYCNLVVLSTTLRHQDISDARFEDQF